MKSDLKICLAQINPTVGDIDGNIQLLRETRKKAHKMGADLIITSELVVTGYPPEDLVLKRAFQKVVEASVLEFARETKDGGPAIILGSPWCDKGKLYNALLLLDAGKVAAQRYKHHLPNYGVFDEARIFSSGGLPGPIHFKGLLIGTMVCEDMWYEDVAECLLESGAEILVSINGSPFEANKPDERISHAVARVTETGLPIIYVNQVGGQDELVFDGGSFVLNADRSLKVKAPLFEESFVCTSWKKIDSSYGCNTNLIADSSGNISAIYKAMTLGLRDYVRKNKFQGILLGISGGIDSALSLAVAVDAIGAKNVRGVMMPSKFTSEESIADANKSSELLNVNLQAVPIDTLVSGFEDALADLFRNEQRDATEENIQARIRAVILMALSNKFGYMVLTTGNKSEMSVGYATLYGDMCGGYSVLKDVYKTTVYELAKWRNQNFSDYFLGPIGYVVPEEVIVKKPTAELAYNQLDEDKLPPYNILDDILLNLIEKDNDIQDVVEKGHDKEDVLSIWKMLDSAEYKRRQAPPGVKLTKKSFGKERRYPITNKFRDNL
tara:strand:+ start:2300 stop:3961 length:1662 start_codon:yes stop_codon:yes gene_type:complete